MSSPGGMSGEEPLQIRTFSSVSHGLFVAKPVRAHTAPLMADDREPTDLDPGAAKRRARWARNKIAERARKAPQEPPPLDPPQIAAIWAERDRRRQIYPHFLWNHPGWHGGRGSFEFQTDVWAVRTIIRAQTGKDRVTAGKIAQWMDANGLTHGFKINSLRTMVYRAFEAIEILETVGRRKGDPPYWQRLVLPAEGAI